MQSLLDDVNELLSKKYGDTSRLLHIKETIEKNKILYTSDRKFLNGLCKTHLGQKNPEIKKQKHVENSKKLDDQLYSVNENTIGNDESNLDMHKIRESNSFCNNCGSKILEKTQFCMECGNSLDNLSQTNISTTPQSSPQHHRQGVKPSAAWYLLPIFFSIIGGIIAWACIRERDPGMAKNNLILGILLTVIPMIFGLVLALGIIAIPYSGLDTFR
jgi:ribosomal protein S27AE